MPRSPACASKGTPTPTAATRDLKLSQDRAAADVDALVALGVARGRLEPVGFGEPVATSTTAEGEK
jgi:outer membrane protein OmpA-like peptidoglycan-associated protein